MHLLMPSAFGFLVYCFTFVKAGFNGVVFSSSVNTTMLSSPACIDFDMKNNNCNLPHCGCNTEYVEAQGNCFLDLSTTPVNQALVQILLDEEVAQCQREGLSVSFSLNLSSSAEALVQATNRRSADLRRNQAVFLALQIVGGHIGLPAILIFALYSRRVHPDPTFVNFCLTWIFSSIVFSLLLYHGTTGNTIINPLGEIEPNLCFAQAALTEGAQLMTACSTLSLNIWLWLGLQTVMRGDEFDCLKGTARNWINAGLLIAPYVFFAAFLLSSAILGRPTRTENLSPQIAPSYFYCSISTSKSFTEIAYGITLVLALTSVGFDAHIISILYRHWRSCWRTKTESAVLIRVVFFSIFRIIVVAADGTAIGILPETKSLPVKNFITGKPLVTNGVPQWIDMLQAFTPLIATLAFGITNDMIMAVTSFVTFWKRDVSTNDQSIEAVPVDRYRYTNTMPAEGNSVARNSVIPEGPKI